MFIYFLMVNVGKYTIDIYIYILYIYTWNYMDAISEYTKYIPNIYCTKYIYIPNIYTKNIPYMLYIHPSTVYYQIYTQLLFGSRSMSSYDGSRQGWSPPGVSQHRQLGSTQGAFAQADGRRDVGRPRWLVGWLVGLVGW